MPESLYEMQIPADFSTSLLYNTNDLCLNKDQFYVLMSLLSGQRKIYVAQNDSDEVFELDTPVDYKDYESLDLFSMTYLSSDSLDWVAVIDEELESGIGVLIADSDLINRFNSNYADELNDTNNLISFFYRDSHRNRFSIQNMVRVLSLLHTAK